MFKFGFSDVDNERDEDDEDSSEQLDWFSASEIKLTSEEIEREYDVDNCIDISICGNNIKTIPSENIVVRLSNQHHENIVEAESRHSDLLPAIYEGGLKIWECSYDLGRYLVENRVALDGKRVLDLGCGAGVLGILALKNGSIVHFQDYNAEVIKLMTIPNVLSNFRDVQVAREKCEFYCGDWESFTNLSSNKHENEEDKYDLVITSETIYNPSNHAKLYQVFKKRLKDNGVGYVAGKTYYFGVGGGMRQFEALVREDGIFDVEIVWKSTQGLQREIMRLVRNKP